ncbi:MAG TPA: hypothetical protein VGI73_00510 [Solirubrobacterales bacterium]|jgi:hypothetical protein
MSAAADLATKVAGALAAILGLAGYVLLLGAAIMWLRVHAAGLPPDVPVSLAAHEELIVIGAQAVGVWVALLLVFGGLGAWIVVGDPAERRFGYPEAALALAVALSVLFAFDLDLPWLLLLPGLAVAIVAVAMFVIWPSLEIVSAALVPIAFAVALGAALAYLSPGNEAASSAGAVLIFGALVLLAPALQRWRAHQEATLNAVARLKAQPREEDEALIAALEENPSQQRPKAVVWTERIALGALFFVVLGVIAVTSQVDKQSDFHKALVSLSNGDCLEGTYVARGGEQLVIAQPSASEGDGTKEEERTRLAVVPVSEILEVQIYGEREEGQPLSDSAECKGVADVLVRPKPGDSSAE